MNLSLGLIFVWRGKESSAVEGLAGARLAAKLKNKMEEQVNDVKRPPLSCLLIDNFFIYGIPYLDSSCG